MEGAVHAKWINQCITLSSSASKQTGGTTFTDKYANIITDNDEDATKLEYMNEPTPIVDNTEESTGVTEEEEMTNQNKVKTGFTGEEVGAGIAIPGVMQENDTTKL